MEPEDVCVAFGSPSLDAVVQISAVLGSNGPINDEMLAEIARADIERSPWLSETEETTGGELRGLTAGFSDDGIDTRMWWLAAGALHVFITYNGAPGSLARNAARLATLLESLRTRPSADADDAVMLARENYGEALDFSERSIEAVERCLSQVHELIPRGFVARIIRRAPSREAIDFAARAFGAYVGEVFRRHRGGVWQSDRSAHDSSELHIALPSGMTFSPKQKALKRILNGPDDNIHDYHRLLVAMTTNHPPHPHP